MARTSLLPAVETGPQELTGILLAAPLCTSVQIPPSQDACDFYSNILHFFPIIMVLGFHFREFGAQHCKIENKTQPIISQTRDSQCSHLGLFPSCWFSVCVVCWRVLL